VGEKVYLGVSERGGEQRGSICWKVIYCVSSNVVSPTCQGVFFNMPIELRCFLATALWFQREGTTRPMDVQFHCWNFPFGVSAVGCIIHDL
jgi:hypothetical protein